MSKNHIRHGIISRVVFILEKTSALPFWGLHKVVFQSVLNNGYIEGLCHVYLGRFIVIYEYLIFTT